MTKRLLLKPKRRMTSAADTGRQAARARRRAQAAAGKTSSTSAQRSLAQVARATDPDLNGRELARVVREQRSRRGRAGQKKSAPTGRRRSTPINVSDASKPAAPESARTRSGAEPGRGGNTVTGTQVASFTATTGDLPGRCQSVTGTEYLSAELFQALCDRSPPASGRRTGQSLTGNDNRVTGNEVGRGSRVTGNETGTCQAVTGTTYLGNEQLLGYCGTQPSARNAGIRPAGRRPTTATNTDVERSNRDHREAPAKVGVSSTQRGGRITGNLLGRSERVTGDRPGSCRNVTGIDYIGQEQYREFCDQQPAPPKGMPVGRSTTMAGQAVTGTMAGRASRVTGAEPGTCKLVTGTPYAGAEQYQAYCEPADAEAQQARTQPRRRPGGAPLTGQQPSVGAPMTGADKGACEVVSGTPYVGADQLAAACPALPADPDSPDYPQPMAACGDIEPPPRGQAPHRDTTARAVTGMRYEQGHITGPFGMARGKVTGTEESRFDRAAVDEAAEAPITPTLIEGRVKSRITGEGMDAGTRITGDDWDRGSRVTGTEGASARRRNPTRRGPRPAEPAPSRPGETAAELPTPVSKVTGGSGNTDRGALVTYSGGARG